MNHPTDMDPSLGAPAMSDVRVASCRAGEIFADPASAELFSEYAAECANPVTGEAATRVPAMYEALEAAGVAQCFAVYVGDELRGFACVMLAVAPEYGMAYARVERLFVASAARDRGAGTSLMESIETYARESGCVDIYYSAPVDSQLETLLSLKRGYMKTNSIFARRLR